MKTGRSASGSLKLAFYALLIGGGVLVLSGSVEAQPTRVVEIGDENGDGRYTGVDVERALKRCRPGCLLRAGAHTYEDVAVVIDKQFPEGLAIEGAGIGQTVFRSPVPVQAPVFWIRGGLSGVVFRDFSLDGRKIEQTNASKISDSVGIRVSDQSRVESNSGRIESVKIEHFLTAGVLIRDGRDWQISKNHIRDIGCHTVRPCPLMPGKDADPYLKGRRSVGYGVLLSGVGASGAVVEENRVADVTKIGIEAFTSNSKLGSKDRVHGVRILGNFVSGALSTGITSNGGVSVEIIGNEIWNSGGSGVRGNSGAGISCGGASEQIVVADNYVHDMGGPGIRLSCQGDGLTVRNNRVERSCLRRPPGYGAIHIDGPVEGGSGLLIEGNHVNATVGSCSYALFFTRWHDVRLSGGSYLGGSRAAIFMADARRIRLQGLLDVSAIDVPLLWIRADVKDVFIAADVRIGRERIKEERSSNLVIEGR